MSSILSVKIVPNSKKVHKDYILAIPEYVWTSVGSFHEHQDGI